MSSKGKGTKSPGKGKGKGSSKGTKSPGKGKGKGSSKGTKSPGKGKGNGDGCIPDEPDIPDEPVDPRDDGPDTDFPTFSPAQCPTKKPDLCDDKCVNTEKSEKHCGECNLACVNKGENCKSGQCRCPNKKPTVCDNECVNTSKSSVESRLAIVFFYNEELPSRRLMLSMLPFNVVHRQGQGSLWRMWQ